MEKSTIHTSRKIYAMKYGMKFVGGITAIYIVGKLFGLDLDASIFVTAIGSAGIIITALNIADGIKGHEPD
jgi:hypothetical protein